MKKGEGKEEKRTQDESIHDGFMELEKKKKRGGSGSTMGNVGFKKGRGERGVLVDSNLEEEEKGGEGGGGIFVHFMFILLTRKKRKGNQMTLQFNHWQGKKRGKKEKKATSW